MGFLRQLVAGAEKRSTLQAPNEWLIDAFAGTATTAGERVTVKSSLGLIAVFAAVSKISEQVGMLPLKVYRELDGGKVEATEHRAWRMLHGMPNPLVPAHRFWSTVTGNVLLWGNSFMEKARSDSVLVDQLWLLDPARVTVEWSERERKKRFVFQEQTGEKRILAEEDVVHVMDFSLDGIVGESRIGRCRQALGKALAREKFESSFYGRGATVRGVIEYPGRLQDQKRLRESWTAVYGGAANAHQVAVLEEGATFKSVQAPMADLQFIEAGQLSTAEIAVLFGLAPSYLGAAIGQGSLVYQTVEGNKIQYATETIAPLSTNIAKTLERDRGIFPFPAWWPEFDLHALMQGDSRARAEFYKVMFEIGAIRPSEVRALEGLPPEDGVDDPPEPPVVAVPSQNGSLNGVEVLA